MSSIASAMLSIKSSSRAQFIEQMYVADIAHLVWEILRLRRCKAGSINSVFRAALETLLTQLLREPGG